MVSVDRFRLHMNMLYDKNKKKKIKIGPCEIMSVSYNSGDETIIYY